MSKNFMERFLKRKLSDGIESGSSNRTPNSSNSQSSSHSQPREINIDDLPRDNFENHPGNDAFVVEGFSSWNKTERLTSHVGDVNSCHNKAVTRGNDLMRQDRSIAVSLIKQSEIVKSEYRIRLNASVNCCRFLLHQGLTFRGHDESEESTNKGNFLELIEFSADISDTARNVVLKNAPRNYQMVSPSIQKDITHCFAQEIIRFIMDEIGSDIFSLMVDECSDVSDKKQLGVMLRYVDRCGDVKERFIGVVHVKETTSSCLKSTIDSIFDNYGLSLKNVRGQVYDGASNMRDEFSGLRALILNENSSAYYVHCFAHQLQLIVVAMAKKHLLVHDFFEMISLLINVIGCSCKRKDMIRERHREEVLHAITTGEITTGRGLNQEISLQRSGNSRWGSHFRTLACLVELFPTILEVLEYIQEESPDYGKRHQAFGVLKYFQSFDFVFNLHLMLIILGITNQLSLILQRNDQDILNAISLVKSTKEHLQSVRDNGWDSIWIKITSFCEKHDISMLNLEEEYIDPRKPRKKTNITNLQYLQVDCFYTVIDLVLQEFNDRFDEVNSELLICMDSLSPVDSFSNFDVVKLMKLAEFYPDDFNFSDRMVLEHQLAIYIKNLRGDERFANLKGLSDLGRMMVKTKKHISHPLVYRLLKLALTLPVATATVERCFSAMKVVKTYMRNQIGDQFLSDCLVCYVESDMLRSVTNEIVIDRFQKMKTRREQY